MKASRKKTFRIIPVLSALIAAAIGVSVAIMICGACADTPPENSTPPVSFSTLTVGDRFTFGRYEQDGNADNGAEAIEWRVISVEDDRALVISEYVLDHLKYNEIKERVLWETSDMRNWMNGEFLNSAFTAEEQEKILTATLEQPENPVVGTPGGNVTEDKIFCLNYAEASELFASDDERIAESTPYARSKGALDGPAWWWLRTPGDNSYDTEFVFGHGSISLYGSYAYADKISARPAMYIGL